MGRAGLLLVDQKATAARPTRRSLAPQTRILLAPHDRFALILPDELLHFPANVRAPVIGKEPETEENFCRPGGVTSPHFSWPRARQTGRSQEAEWTLRPRGRVAASDQRTRRASERADVSTPGPALELLSPLLHRDVTGRLQELSAWPTSCRNLYTFHTINETRAN